jgi:hypothetical protein
MSDSNNRPDRPNRDVRGDDKAMPDRGVKTGVTDTYGGNLNTGLSGTRKITDCTKSDGKIEGGLSKNKR